MSLVGHNSGRTSYTIVTFKKKKVKKLLGITVPTLTIVLSEFLGTAILVFGTCMGNAKGMASGSEISQLQLGLVSGFSLMTVIQIFGHISGAHVNPAISLSAVIMKEISLKLFPIYVLSQVAGCLAGYGLLMVLTPEHHLDGANGHCVTFVHEDLSLIQACVVEILATFILTLAVCAAWDPKNATNNDAVPLKIGFLLFWLIITAGYYTGASLNPVRSFGPAVCNNKWENHWVYWVGPMIGGALAGGVYKNIFYNHTNR